MKTGLSTRARLLPPGERRHGFVMPAPHTRSARKNTQMYVHALRPLVHEIAAALEVPDGVLRPGVPPREIGAAYLAAFLDVLDARLMHD
ncbi:MAG: hypothetical protein QN183_05740 [Armatimonadota bacterium]|nr:hypothetical protein [Armatimonadota bacterium]MDR7534702.1 hypothetical protein [Armatimonadota bacterium]MDR7535849.1 hypothetical protein [Armatimonadota bacterium]